METNRLWRVWETEYREDGYCMVEAATAEEAKQRYRKLTGGPGDKTPLTVKPDPRTIERTPAEAAAGDLLEALEGMVKVATSERSGAYVTRERWEGARDRALTAIAKARGGEA